MTFMETHSEALPIMSSIIDAPSYLVSHALVIAGPVFASRREKRRKDCSHILNKYGLLRPLSR
eukprot:3368337-Pleurochrysis_carterae.AAC.1